MTKNNTNGSGPAFTPTRRQALAVIGAGVGAALLSGKGALAQETPRRGGTLTVMLELDTKSLDPLFGNATTIQRKLYHLYAEALLLQDESFVYQPWLAESWATEEGGKAIVFKLRQGVTFHDGEPFNAAAAKANLDRLVDPSLKPYPAQYVRELVSTDVVDDYTIRLNLSSPSVLMLPLMAAEAGMMMSPKAIRELGNELDRQPVGTGPFRVVSRSTGETVTERNENYWQKAPDGQSLPYLDGVRMSINGNSTVRLLQLQSGAAQLSDPVSVKDFPTVRSDPGLELLDANLGGAFIVSFNLRRPPLDNIDLRKALSLSIDRDVLVKVVTGGEGVVLKGLEPPFSFGYSPDITGHTLDLEAAKAAYAKSGHSGPLSLSIIQRDDDAQVAEILQQMWQQAGINVEIQVLERLAFVEKVLTNNDFDMTLSRSPLQQPDIHTQYTFSYSRKATTNYSGVNDEEIYGLVDDALVELDPAKRKQIYAKVQQLIVDRYYQSFLFWNPRREVASKKLHGIRHDGSTIWLYDQMWLDA